MLLGQRKGYFFIILLVSREKLLSHDWSVDCIYSNSLCYQEVVAKTISATMAPRFEI